MGYAQPSVSLRSPWTSTPPTYHSWSTPLKYGSRFICGFPHPAYFQFKLWSLARTWVRNIPTSPYSKDWGKDGRTQNLAAWFTILVIDLATRNQICTPVWVSPQVWRLVPNPVWCTGPLKSAEIFDVELVTLPSIPTGPFLQGFLPRKWPLTPSSQIIYNLLYLSSGTTASQSLTPPPSILKYSRISLLFILPAMITYSPQC